MALRLSGIALWALSQSIFAAPAPPLVCPAGGPIGSVDLRVASSRGKGDPLPLRTINHLEEGDTLLYRPVLRSGERREGEVAMVLVPANKTPAGEKLIILEPKPAGKPQTWTVPVRVSVAAFVYGPAGLNRRRVKNFLDRDEDLVAQLADYAEKTSQTEALIAALSTPNSSAANVQSALQGFSSQYGLSVQIDKAAPMEQQAMALFRTLNPAIANYDPISPQRTQSVGQTASLATSVAALFFGSPVGLAAGGTAMLLELRSLAFPRAEFRSSFAQPLPQDGLGLCGRREPAGPHTKVAYLWASRVPNTAAPQLAIDSANSLPDGIKSPLPIVAADPDWKFVDRAHGWALQPENGSPVPIKALKLGDTKMLEIDPGQALKPGKYRLVANWDWDRFTAKGEVIVKPLSDFASTRLPASSQDLLIAKTGKVPVSLEGGNFEFVTKVEIEKINDKFAAPAPVPFILPLGLRRGTQDRMDIQVNTNDLEPGAYKLLISQVDGKSHRVEMKILPAPPQIENLPVVLNEGARHVTFQLKGHRLELLSKLEVANGNVELGPAWADQTERQMTLHMDADVRAGTVVAAKAYVKDRGEPLTFADAVHIAGPRPRITELNISIPPEQDVQLEPDELPGNVYLSAKMRLEHLQSNSVLRLDCEQPGRKSLTLHLGEQAGPVSLQQLTADQVFLSFDTGAWLNGCILRATAANGSEGESEPFRIGRILRVPKIESFELSGEDSQTGQITASFTGRSLETIEKIGWNPEQGETIVSLPLPVAGESEKQALQVRLAVASSGGGTLYVWLRGEAKARAVKLPGKTPGDKSEAAKDR